MGKEKQQYARKQTHGKEIYRAQRGKICPVARDDELMNDGIKVCPVLAIVDFS